MEIYIEDKTGMVEQKHLDDIVDVLNFSGQHLQLDEATEMSVTIMDNNDIQTFNREYRGKDVPTDVISFAIEDEEDIPTELLEEMGLPRNIGDILISIDKAKEQAKEYGHSFERELGFLAVHGFLHLNGYDHMNEEDEKEMFGLQREILDAYGLQR
ncbi:rRNA maturation RNase YbeY [Vagococcus zengguangii]|uniref:Endoribonuclease YbeY n=1 Tax=Vagococcus zengguangii TaxID=2571750 RepID=A0A4D7CXP5_9ENTE|nr:rRNA maturation RNase YbeY [Vagococcus zengguangii]QCI86586.1 rRNA maturation RNase YbeY [Vagococcus zengguangii]TLG81165.1 rRNA maturation RNase YbeY [Vagococcus zengguangii]